MHLPPVPARAVLVGQQDELARRSESRRAARLAEEDQSEQTQRLRLVGQLRDQQPSQTDAARRQVGPDQVVAGRGVSGGVGQVHDRQHRVETLRQLLVGRQPERHAGGRDLLLRASDPRRDRRLLHEQHLGDLGSGQAAHQPQGQRQLGVACQGRVAAGEDQTQRVGRHGFLRIGLHRLLDEEQRELAPQGLLATQPVQRLPLRDGGQPPRGVVGYAVRPAAQRLHERVLRAVLGEVDVTREAHRRRQDRGPVASMRLLDATSDVASVDHARVTQSASGSCRRRAGPRPDRTGRSPPSPEPAHGRVRRSGRSRRALPSSR